MRVFITETCTFLARPKTSKPTSEMKKKKTIPSILTCKCYSVIWKKKKEIIKINRKKIYE